MEFNSNSAFMYVVVAVVIAFVLPVSMHPMALAGFPVAVAVLLGLAIAHFHRRA